jgi:hypothetical protein
VRYDWYVDENKVVHFFSKGTLSAPFDLTDSSGNYVYTSLRRLLDGSQIANRVKVRGGEYDGDTYTDSITVAGDATKSFRLPYKFSNLTVKLNTVAQVVGIDFIDNFSDKDVLHSFQEQTIRWETALSDADVIEFSGNPKVRVFAIAEDPPSIALYGKIEKLIRDNNITSNTVARQRAIAELYAYSASLIDAEFYTRTVGLRAGMQINISSTLRGSDDSLIIKSLVFRPIDKDNFGYDVKCVSQKRQGLIELLQSILEPEPQSTD